MYRRPTFDAQTLSVALQKQHRTKARAWALIHVVEGRILPQVQEPIGETVLTAGENGIVRSEQAHELQLLGPVRLFIEFFVPPAAAQKLKGPPRGPRAGRSPRCLTMGWVYSPKPRLRPRDQFTSPPGKATPEMTRPTCCSSAGRHGTKLKPSPSSIMANRPLES